MNGHAIKGMSAALVRGLFGRSGQTLSSGVRTAARTGAEKRRRIRVRTTLLHAPVVAILGALLPLAATAQQPPVPAPEVTMVTNFGQPVVPGRVRKLHEVAPALAQGFTTGGDRGNFEATRIGFKVAAVNKVDGFDVTASLHEAQATGRPGMKIAELVGPSSIGQYRRNYWDVPDGIILEPDTSYVVVLRCDVGGTAAEICNGDEHIRIKVVVDDDEDDVDHGADEGLFDGWSIADDGLGGVWRQLTFDDTSHAIEVKGYSARIPYVIDDGVTVTSTPGNGGDSYSYGETIEISVRLSRAILVDFDPIVIENALGIVITQDRPLYPDIAPSLRFSLGNPGEAQDRYAYYAGGNYTNTLKFHYIVTSGDKDTDGIEIPGGDDAFGHNPLRAFTGDTTLLIANFEFPEPGIQTNHTVDSTPTIDTANMPEPVRITSVPAIGTTYRNREVVEVTVTFDQPVLVTPPVFASIGIDGNSGRRRRSAEYSHGSGTESVAFRYVITQDDSDTDGIEILPNLLAQGGDPHHVNGVRGSGDITSLRGNLTIDLASDRVPDDPNHKVDGSMVRPHVEVSPGRLAVEEGDSAGAGYLVWLTEEPSGSVTVTVDGFSGTDVSVDSASLTFTTTDWSTRQTVTVTAGQDDDTEDDEVTLTHTVAGGGYDSAAADDVTVTVRDNDTQGVTASAMALTVPEGGTAEYTVVLNAEPATDVTVIVTGASGDVSIDGAIDGDRVLTFTSVNWNAPQTVTVRAAEDGDAVADDPVTLTNALAGGGSVTVTVTVAENDTTSVSVAPTALRVNEGSTGTYTVVLTAQPTGDVRVTVSGASGDVTVDKPSLTFTAVTWETAQTVTVTAGQDADGVNDTVTLTHAVSGGGYDGVVVPDVEVTVEDADRGVTVSETELTVAEGDAAGSSYTVVLGGQPSGPVTVTVGGHAGTDVSVGTEILRFTPATWETEQTVTVTAGQDADALDDTVTLTHSVSGGGYDGVEVASVEVTVTDDDGTPVEPIWTCGARLGSPTGRVWEAEIDICWNVGSPIPTGSDVVIEFRVSHFHDNPEAFEAFSEWTEVAGGNQFKRCPGGEDTCMKSTHTGLFRGAAETYELRIRRNSTVLAKSPLLKTHAPNSDSNPFEPRLSAAGSPGSRRRVDEAEGPFEMALFFTESYGEGFNGLFLTEAVPCLGSDALCLEPADFDITNGIVTAVAVRDDCCYKVSVTPTALGQPVTISLRAGTVKGPRGSGDGRCSDRGRPGGRA